MLRDVKELFILSAFFAAATASVWWDQRMLSYTSIPDNYKLITDLLVAAIGSAAGAFGGAYIIEKLQNKKTILEEYRNTNAGIMLSFSVFNSLVNLRSQHTNDLRENFYVNKGRLELHEFGIFHYQPNVSTLQAIAFSIEPLKKILFEKTTISQRPVCVVNILDQTLASLNDSISLRNNTIYQLKNGNYDDEQSAQLYFGLRQKDGNIDMTYCHSIDCICSAVEDAQFFSKLLCEDLEKHARQIRDKIGDTKLKINQPNFASVDASLMPKEDKYSDWRNNFK
jgi:hypothetical protein